MIFVLATQGIGVQWGAFRSLKPEQYKVISKVQHLQPRPRLDHDRVIEVGPGPAEHEAAKIKSRLLGGGWPAEEVEWQPMIPATVGPPPKAKGGQVPGSFQIGHGYVDPGAWQLDRQVIAALAKSWFSSSSALKGPINDV